MTEITDEIIDNDKLMTIATAAIYQAGYKKGYERGFAWAKKDSGYAPLLYSILSLLGGFIAVIILSGLQ